MSGPDKAVVIAGGGQAGFQTAASLRQGGFAGRVVLVGDEPVLPYQRPPLSKVYLSRPGTDGIRLRGAEFFEESEIELLRGECVAGIDRADRSVTTESGTTVGYDHLVLALGSRNRALPVPGADLDGVAGLRTVADADALRAALPSARDVVVIGGGFIGLEFAVAAVDAGAKVTVVEALPRLMSRVVSEPTSEFFAGFHRARGVDLLFGTSVSRIVGEGGAATGVELADGTRIDADLVVAGIGVRPNTELAERAGLSVDDGIVVDETLRTSDPAISAVGDCARFPSPHAGCPVRLESVQNAVDQARHVASRLLTGEDVPYEAVPWFWTDQGAAKLQIAGLVGGHDRRVVRGDRDEGRFTIFCYRGDRLLGAESVGRAVDHMAVRRILTAGAALTPEQASDVDFDLKAHSKSLTSRPR
ncbi:FAD-dependent pyridine nucleotide-disulfide oxidoreductase [Saccharopolyspora erythraea D]|uniref:NAD(P)/FAD-dependent oxidoreductase n=1 Tax=Saccharopolyspora erythraea TaxID=1836 RepID=UPI00038CDF2D|nr:FAD-dependent oxidoreductase [Saccharopolyspora erythraea]EQD86023.1 FAD-dependent pyridine nucleotide-disulfide oxidoreductase [Saccharopolyspora erythraea D]